MPRPGLHISRIREAKIDARPMAPEVAGATALDALLFQRNVFPPSVRLFPTPRIGDRRREAETRRPRLDTCRLLWRSVGRDWRAVTCEWRAAACKVVPAARDVAPIAKKYVTVPPNCVTVVHNVVPRSR